MSGIEQAVDPLARQQLAASAMAAHGFGATPESDLGQTRAQVGDQRQVVLAIGRELGLDGSTRDSTAATRDQF